MEKIIRIGTRESQLAVWQATTVQQLLLQYGFKSELVYIKSDGDIDLVTPLYALGVQGIFTKTLDAALLSNRIDIAVHSMKDVPTQLAEGIEQAAVLKRASYKDILVYKGDVSVVGRQSSVIATSSTRRKALWLNRYPKTEIDNLRGNVNTRLQKLNDSNWTGAIFAAAGLERIGLRPENSMELDWMLPAPAQGAIMIVCRQGESFYKDAAVNLNDADTAICVKAERDFLKVLMGGCSTPISALAIIENNKINFKGSVCSLDGKEKIDVEQTGNISEANNIGTDAANELLNKGGKQIVESIRNATK
jgi:hydroxymethylbilane synthase